MYVSRWSKINNIPTYGQYFNTSNSIGSSFILRAHNAQYIAWYAFVFSDWRDTFFITSTNIRLGLEYEFVFF